jgi:O-methyltransferase
MTRVPASSSGSAANLASGAGQAVPASDMLRRLLARFLLATGRRAPDLSSADQAIIARVKSETRTSRDRIAAMIDSARHIARHRLPGDVVECGVWRGGSVMAAALALLEEGDTGRTLWLYDTYAGQVGAGPKDLSVTGVNAQKKLARGTWNVVSTDLVRGNVASTGWPTERTRLVVGRVEDTIPHDVPDRIALLRLDTDWYDSTRHELQHLYPRLVSGGILIVDDYGHWAGCRQAVDEYFEGQRIFLHRIDYSGRLVVKP